VISLSVLFWMFVILFALIGATRGWAKEILVTSGVILAIFLIKSQEILLPLTQNTITPRSSFWVQIAILGVITFLGYQVPKMSRRFNNRNFIRGIFENVILGFFLGALNGYLLFGTAWYFVMEAGYPFDWISAPDQGSDIGQNVMDLLEILPPQWLQTPAIYIAAAVALVFILVVFI